QAKRTTPDAKGRKGLAKECRLSVPASQEVASSWHCTHSGQPVWARDPPKAHYRAGTRGTPSRIRGDASDPVQPRGVPTCRESDHSSNEGTGRLKSARTAVAKQPSQGSHRRRVLFEDGTTRRRGTARDRRRKARCDARKEKHCDYKSRPRATASR